ncbi:MAG: DUF2461 domain-containing protein [Bacteroidetes bacterium]|nr:DUF2461 domain-containing protein [Bacteroidota bacterium]
MKSAVPNFDGFKPNTFKFLSDLEKDKNNNTSWFAVNRSRYENFLVLPAKSFVFSIGQFFNHLNPSIRTEPKFNETLMRINKDMRFAKGGPYRSYFLIHFGRFKMDSEFFVYLDSSGIEYGIFLNNTAGENLFFSQNLSTHKPDLFECCKRFKINNKFGLYELNKGSDNSIPRFNIQKNFDDLVKMKYIIIQKKIDLKSKLIYSDNFLTEAIKTFSNLYALYCFAISSNPLKLIEDFDDRLGVAV